MAGLSEQVQRGLLKRCPRCGRGRPFRTYFKMKPSCEVCAYPFERESGYWTGAMIVNIAVAEIWFFVLFVVSLLVMAPDINWTILLVLGLATNALLPVIFYPYSKSLWMALDLHFHPLESDEN